MAGAPRVSSAGGELLRELAVVDESGERRRLWVPMERPLSIIVDGQELITLLTLGAKAEWLVLGYMRNQRLVGQVTDVESISVDWTRGRAEVVLKAATAGAVVARQRSGTACGLGTVFADWLEEVSPVAPWTRGKPQVSHTSVLRILETMREYAAVHGLAGSVHGCALFQDADLMASIEDVSRHNGLDTVTGWMMMHGVEGGDKTLFTTGRLTGEMVLKAAHNGVSIMVSRNGVTSMGYEIGVKLGMALFGRAAKGRYLCYAGSERLT